MTSQHNLTKSFLHKTQRKTIQRLTGKQSTDLNTQDIQDLKQLELLEHSLEHSQSEMTECRKTNIQDKSKQ